MIKQGRYIYGTVKECVGELWNMVDFKIGKFPDFDFAASVKEKADSLEDAYQTASSWFGCKNVSSMFDSDTIVLLFGHWGGGGVESMELTDDDYNKKVLVDKIWESTENVGVGISRDDYTLFEIK